MLAELLNEMLAILRATFLHGDWISLLIAFGSVVVAVMVMKRGTQVGSMTLMALTLFALGGYLRNLFAGPRPEGGSVTGGRLVSEFNDSLGQFMDLTAANLLGYFLAFMLVILVLFGFRSILGR